MAGPTGKSSRTASSPRRNRAVDGHYFGIASTILVTLVMTSSPAALDLYTRQCALRVTAKDLATMGATLADGGVDPVTGARVVDASACRHTLAVMTTAGLYETSGDWLYDVGLPGKSGIGGGIVTVAPGKGGLGTFSPPLDGAVNSVRGQNATRMISRGLGLDLFASEPLVAARPAARPSGASDP